MATMGLPPLPGGGPPAGPESAPEGPTTMEGLLPQGAAAPTPTPDVQERARAIMRQVRDVMMTIEALARQFPPAAKPLRNSLNGLQEALVAIVSDLNRTQEAPPTPRTLA